MSIKQKRKFLLAFIYIVVILIAIVFAVSYFNGKNETSSIKTEIVKSEKELFSESDLAIKDKKLSKFDLSFLKLENKKENKVYSPLSIKYALKMLEEATSGKSQQQIAGVIKAYNLTKYESNKNMAFANAFFIRNSFQESVNEEYVNTLKEKYNADVKFDDFNNADNINSWIKMNTLNLITDVLNNDDVNRLDFALVNALGIDMEWNHKFLVHNYDDDEHITFSTDYHHAKLQNGEWGFNWIADENLYSKKFDDYKNVTCMKVYASINNYDAVKELGEDYIRSTVFEDFKNWALQHKDYEGNEFNNDFSDENIQRIFNAWFDDGKVLDYEGNGEGYITELDRNYKKVDYSTDFSFYVDDDVKVFAKDLKEYENTTLQYIGIMPRQVKLQNYIENIDYTDITSLINNLKNLRRSDVKDGYLTYIHGYIPKFEFDYELNIIEDLKQMGITDIFEEESANLTQMTSAEGAYINTLKHKANIEFTQDGIKASAVTLAGGAGAGEWYDYYFEIPTEDIDITFDKPYMFLIRDKYTGEIWFVGTVYEPLDVKDELSEHIFNAWEDMEGISE